MLRRMENTDSALVPYDAKLTAWLSPAEKYLDRNKASPKGGNDDEIR